jgi:hypothetical protein
VRYVVQRHVVVFLVFVVVFVCDKTSKRLSRTPTLEVFIEFYALWRGK